MGIKNLSESATSMDSALNAGDLGKIGAQSEAQISSATPVKPRPRKLNPRKRRLIFNDETLSLPPQGAPPPQWLGLNTEAGLPDYNNNGLCWFSPPFCPVSVSAGEHAAINMPRGISQQSGSSRADQIIGLHAHNAYVERTNAKRLFINATHGSSSSGLPIATMGLANSNVIYPSYYHQYANGWHMPGYPYFSNANGIHAFQNIQRSDSTPESPADGNPTSEHHQSSSDSTSHHSTNGIRCALAPDTPDKSINLERLLNTQSSCCFDLNSDGSEQTHTKILTSPEVEGTQESPLPQLIDSSSFLLDKGVGKITDDAAALDKKNGGNVGIDLNSTPPPTKPKKKKHRPKVIADSYPMNKPRKSNKNRKKPSSNEQPLAKEEGHGKKPSSSPQLEREKTGSPNAKYQEPLNCQAELSRPQEAIPLASEIIDTSRQIDNFLPETILLSPSKKRAFRENFKTLARKKEVVVHHKEAKALALQPLPDQAQHDQNQKGRKRQPRKYNARGRRSSKGSVHDSQSSTLGLFPQTPLTDIDILVYRLKQLQLIESEIGKQMVPYIGERGIVPYEGPKRKIRPKVDLDAESNRIWKLLMGKASEEDKDPTSQEAQEKMQRDRELFQGRVESFIALMRQVQGDRRFSQWKGSVLDSVVGVYLTQNVSDHASSSAFMNLASQYPPDEKNKGGLSDGFDEYASSIAQNLEASAPHIEEDERTTSNSNSLDENELDEEIREYIRNILLDEASTQQNPGVSSVSNEIYALREQNLNETANCDESFASNPLGDKESSSQVMNSANGSDSNLDMAERINGHDWINSFHDTHSFTELLREVENRTFQASTTFEKQNDLDAKDHPCDFLGRDSQDQDEQCNISSTQDSSLTKEMHPNRLNPSVEGIESSELAESSTLPYPPSRVNGVAKAGNTTKGQGRQKRTFTAKPKINWNAEWKKAMNLHSEILKARDPSTRDAVNWEAVRRADVKEISSIIKDRGMNNVLAVRIKDFLNLIYENQEGNLDLEWLKYVEPNVAKEILLSVYGLGLKSVECIRLLALRHLAFPVDTNVGRISVRLGWVPLQPLPESLQIHLLDLYPMQSNIQKYLWPRLCVLDQRTLYELHYQMITFGKVFCTKNKPNCNACPMRSDCKHFASAFASAKLALPAPPESSSMENRAKLALQIPPESSSVENHAKLALPAPPESSSVENHAKLALPAPPESSSMENHAKLTLPTPPESSSEENPQDIVLAVPPTAKERETTIASGILPLQMKESSHQEKICEPIIEEPATPEPECTERENVGTNEYYDEDPDEIPPLELDLTRLRQHIQEIYENNIQDIEDSCSGALSKALVMLSEKDVQIPVEKLKNVSRLRTEHYVYEIPDNHPLLRGYEAREPNDPSPYLLVIWMPDETSNFTGAVEQQCGCRTSDNNPCNQETCSASVSMRETNEQIVKGTILIPIKTAMRGSFPLNGTYFQFNEVFADHETSLNPLNVPRSWIWNLKRCKVLFGTSIPSIMKGLSWDDIGSCFWKGYVCLRGFERTVRAPGHLFEDFISLQASKLKLNKQTETQN